MIFWFVLKIQNDLLKNSQKGLFVCFLYFVVDVV